MFVRNLTPHLALLSYGGGSIAVRMADRIIGIELVDIPVGAETAERYLNFSDVSETIKHLLHLEIFETT